jgi:ferritin
MNIKIEKALNDQISMEANAHYLYLSIASYYETVGMDGVATFFYDQSAEEQMHMMKIFRYVNEMDGHALVPPVKKQPHVFKGVLSTFELTYKHEKNVTGSINKIVELSAIEKDHGTYNFLQWFVEEQREEEALMRSILDKIKLIGDGPQSNYFIDREIKEINSQSPDPKDAEK